MFLGLPRTPAVSPTLAAVDIIGGCFEQNEKTENKKNEDKRTVWTNDRVLN